MNTAADAVDQVFRITLEGVTFLFRLIQTANNMTQHKQMPFPAGLGFDPSSMPLSEGEVPLQNLFASGEGIACVMIPESQKSNLIAGMQEGKITYALSNQIKNSGRQAVYQVMVPKSQASMLANIMEAKGINSLMQAEGKPEKEQAAAKDSEEQKKKAEEPVVEKSNQELNAEFLQKLRENRGKISPERQEEMGVIPPPLAERMALPTIASPSSSAYSEKVPAHAGAQKEKDKPQRPSLEDKIASARRHPDKESLELSEPILNEP